MDEPRLLTGEDGADLGLEQAKLTCVDGTGEIDRDTDLTDTFADDACKVETVPHVTAVGACPTVVGRNGLRPGATQQLPPVNARRLRGLQAAGDSGRQLSSQLRSLPARRRSASRSMISSFRRCSGTAKCLSGRRRSYRIICGRRQ